MPAAKSIVAVSCSVGPGTVKLGASVTAELPAGSTDVMRKKYVEFGVRPVNVMVCWVTNAAFVTLIVSAGGNSELSEYSTFESASSFVLHEMTAVEPSIAVALMREITGAFASATDSAKSTSTQ